jgi:hypothetical protein
VVRSAPLNGPSAAATIVGMGASPDLPTDVPASGVVFPRTADGRRSTTALGREVVAAALRPVDPMAADAAAADPQWRSGYLAHFRRLVEAGRTDPVAARAIADAGIAAVHARMRVADPSGTETPLAAALDGAPARPLTGTEVRGTAAPERELSVPFRGERLRGDALLRQLERWTAAGTMEPGAAAAVRTVAENPEWLTVPDRQVVVLGAGAEMGPLPALLRWGATVVAVDLPRTRIWQRLLERGASSAGRLIVPLPTGVPQRAGIAENAGADLLHELPAVADWLLGLPDPLVLGNYVYADGATNVRVAVAVDGLTERLLGRRDDVALAFLATPTDVFVAPEDAVAHANAAFDGRSRASRLAARPLQALSGGRLLQRAYPAAGGPAIIDSLVPQQGPNYALAKRLQRWRATTARHAGATVSLHVAPPTRTRSVVKNRALAAAYAGAHRFGVEIFEPATSNTLMAALLVHDLHTCESTAHQHPWQDEASTAVHGGLWRAGYAPRSALGLAALLGIGGARA